MVNKKNFVPFTYKIWHLQNNYMNFFFFNTYLTKNKIINQKTVKYLKIKPIFYLLEARSPKTLELKYNDFVLPLE